MRSGCSDVWFGLNLKKNKSSRVTAEFLRHTLKCRVRREPEAPVTSAIRKVRIEVPEKFGDNEKFYTNLASEQGTDNALEKQMYRERAEAVGPTPKDRNLFILKTSQKEFMRST